MNRCRQNRQKNKNQKKYDSGNKFAVLERVQAGIPKCKVARDFDIPESTIRFWSQNAAKIQKLPTEDKCTSKSAKCAMVSTQEQSTDIVEKNAKSRATFLEEALKLKDETIQQLKSKVQRMKFNSIRYSMPQGKIAVNISQRIYIFNFCG